MKIEEARHNWQDTLKHLEKKKQDFVRIGELLTDCHRRRYWSALGFASFRQYVQDGLSGHNVDYPLATRYMKVYKFSVSPEAPPVEWRKIPFHHLYLLVEKHKQGKVPPALWSRAATLTHSQLRYELGYEGGQPAPASPEYPSRHTQTKRRIKGLGEILGKYAKQDYLCTAYKPDVVWKVSEQAMAATHVFEIQHGGDLDHALTTLWDAYKTLDNPRLFLIITMLEDGDKAKRIVARLYPDMHESFVVMTATQIDQLYTTLTRVRGDLTKLTKPAN
jgi:hypothetical protein